MINVLYTSDNAYLPFLGISLYSLLFHNQSEKIRVYLVLLDPSQDNLKKLRQLEETFSNCEIRIIDGSPYVKQMKSLRMIQYRKSYAPNLRLFFGQYIDRDVDRLLYLDCDTIVTGSITGLFTMPMDCVAGVVLDSLTSSYKHCLQYTDEEHYFNSGVLLINTKAWNMLNCTEKLFSMMANPEYVHANPDQDYLNQLLHDQIKILGPEYNLQPHHMCLSNDVYFRGYSRKGYYSDQEITHAVHHPVIIHAYRFCGKFPWHIGNVHPALSEYLKYKNMSPWRDMPDLEANENLLFHLEELCWKYMPKSLFFFIWSTMQKVYFRYHDKRTRRTARAIFKNS